MEKILIEPEARFKLEKLCDFKHPEEVGGYLLGLQIEEDVLIQDAFPVPNVHETNRRNHYKEHSWGASWSKIYGATNGLNPLGRFHSHPNGSIPSAQDMKSCRGLNIWVIHHGIGQHTFSGSRDFKNREVLLLNEERETPLGPHFVGDQFHLGTPVINQMGRLDFDDYSVGVLSLKNETRRLLLLALKHARPSSGFVDLEKVVDEAGKTRQTVRKHLVICVKKGLLDKHYSRGDYRIDWNKIS